MAAPTVQGSAEAYGTHDVEGNPSITHGFTGVQAGDLFLCFIFGSATELAGDVTDNNGTEPFTDAGHKPGDAVGDNGIHVFYRYADDASPQTTFDFSSTAGGTNPWAVHAYHIRGVNQTAADLFDVSVSDSTQATTGGATSINAPSITTSQNDCLAFCIGGGDMPNDMDPVTNNGFTGGQDNTDTWASTSGYKTISTAGSVGATTVTWTGSNDGHAFQIALAPVGVEVTDVANSGETPGSGTETWNDGSTGNVATGTGFVRYG